MSLPARKQRREDIREVSIHLFERSNEIVSHSFVNDIDDSGKRLTGKPHVLELRTKISMTLAYLLELFGSIRINDTHVLNATLERGSLRFGFLAIIKAIASKGNLERRVAITNDNVYPRINLNFKPALFDTNLGNTRSNRLKTLTSFSRLLSGLCDFVVERKGLLFFAA